MDIDVFFATDDNYVPFLSVAIKSLLQNSSSDYFYNIHILTDNLCSDNIEMLKKEMLCNSRLIIDEMRYYIKGIEKDLQLSLRDYYTVSIFYRIFIGELYPNLKKAIYLDSDIVVVGDISKLYVKNINNYLLGAVVDDVVLNNPHFKKYVKYGVGVDSSKYFNSGVMIINLERFREENIVNKFINLLTTYCFESSAPDQDYLNVLCRDKVMYLEKGWNKMPIDKNYNGEIYIIHYNNFRKPWFYDGVLHGESFWKYALKSVFCKKIESIKNNFSSKMKKRHICGFKKLLDQTHRIVRSDINFKKIVVDVDRVL